MKVVIKSSHAPLELSTLLVKLPKGTWDDARNDVQANGEDTSGICKSLLVSDQFGLCAYCEIDIGETARTVARVEHFHSKSDTGGINWALSWSNLLAVCDGGSNPHATDPDRYLAPTPQNLSCDSFKNYATQCLGLPEACEGWILNPVQLAAFPAVFELNKFSGELRPNEEYCTSRSFSPNHHGSTAQLVQHTIKMLNLNCERLTTARLSVVWQIERDKKAQRQLGIAPQDAIANICTKYYRKKWPRFFSTIRLCLGPFAETHLHSIGYQG